MRWSVAPGLVLVIIAACTGDGAIGTTVTSNEPTTILTTPTSTLPPVVECPGEGEFEEGGGIAEADAIGGDSSTIGQISWETSDRCETFHFDFETSEGAPATSVPDIRVDHLESLQVVRVTMDVQASVIADQLVETELVERLYVVRSLDGGMFVDLHLSAPAAVRATTRSSPARLSVDLRPGFVPFTGESTIDDRVVLVSPSSETVAEGDTTLFAGYSRTFEGNVLVVVTQAGSTLTETSTTAADFQETWGEFRAGLSLPTGEVSVFLGERSPEDGSLMGVTIDLTVS